MKIYIASKAIHRPRWRELRAKGLDIISRWIDVDDRFSDDPEGLNYRQLWRECFEDIWACDALVLYVKDGEILKGALVEIGAATANGKPVYIYGPTSAIEANGTWRHLPNVIPVYGEPENLLP